MLVNIIGQDPDVRVFLEHVCERLEIGFGIAAAGRVRRRVQDQPAGLGCDRCFQLRRGQFEIGFLRAINDHRYTVEQDYDIRIADPIGCGTMTSSPGFRVAIMALKMTGLPPQLT